MKLWFVIYMLHAAIGSIGPWPDTPWPDSSIGLVGCKWAAMSFTRRAPSGMFAVCERRASAPKIADAVPLADFP